MTWVPKNGGLACYDEDKIFFIPIDGIAKKVQPVKPIKFRLNHHEYKIADVMGSIDPNKIVIAI